VKVKSRREGLPTGDSSRVANPAFFLKKKEEKEEEEKKKQE
jgi:hypothetical protein